MRSTLLSLVAISLVSLVTASPETTTEALSIINPRGVNVDKLAPRTFGNKLESRNHLKQVTRQQLLEREAKANLLRARQVVPPPQQLPIPSTTVTVALGYVDDVVFPLQRDFPFDMVLFGKTYDTSNLEMSSNGFVRFGGGSGVFTNSPLPNDIGDVVLAPYFDDLVLLDASYAMEYTFTDKMVKFEWQTVPFSNRVPTAYVHFEMEYLVDTPNIVYVRYLQDSNPDYLSGSSATIGVQAVSDNIAYQYSNNNQDSAGVAIPSAQTAAPGRTLIIDTATGSFTMLS